MSLFAGIVGVSPDLGGAVATRRFAAALDAPGAAAARDWCSASSALVHRQRRSTPEDRFERQPLAGVRTVLMYDGRLDNREEVAHSLGIAITGIPDSAVVLAALERWGDDAVSRLLGPFALAWWDDDDRRLLLARDPLGHRALYHVEIGGGLAFATTPRALLALPEVPRGIDEAGLAAFLVNLPMPPGASFFQDIGQIPAAHVAIWQPGRLVSRRYWQPDFSSRLRFRRDEDYVEAAREHLTNAVRRCLRTDGPIAAHLTGGLDSTAVATTTARLIAPARLMTLTAVPADGRDLPEIHNHFVDEGQHALATAALYPNMDPRLSAGSAVQRYETDPLRLFLLAGHPFRNIMNLGWFGPMDGQARAAGIRVVLGGGGGNLGLSWDGVSGLRDAARAGRLARLWREIPALARARNTSVGRLAWSMVLRPLLPVAAPRWLDRCRGRPESPLLQMSAIHPAFAAAHDLSLPLAKRMRAIAFSGEAGMRRLLLETHQKNSVVRSVLRAVQGFDLRTPLCDLRLLEFCFAVPNDQYLRNGVTRWLSRRVLEGRAPPEVVNERRRGLQAADFMHRLQPRREEFLATIEDLERSPLASRCLDLPRLKRLATDMPTVAAAEHLMPYVAVLDRGLHIGRFIRWVEGGNG